MLDKGKVKKIAYLARIKVENLDQATADFNSTLKMIDQLQEVDTGSVEPMYTPAEGNQPLREDVVTAGGIVKELVQCAPSSLNNCYVVPKVIE